MTARSDSNTTHTMILTPDAATAPTAASIDERSACSNSTEMTTSIPTLLADVAASC
eukprot:CAMPEP_0181292078 /NCGR_PEP_ID=MMETSP1101-20121128/2311_1 /TAXON_ID=46948 /ORGANISM="Rhodomonas abbreviata, Strain Caron Lab Isolate" /LENGTH=55 /DNA_ID=CAMNT_0023396517 /DNA_START=295 /DNA_END=459 /DNA_ORIENTATION=+